MRTMDHTKICTEMQAHIIENVQNRMLLTFLGKPMRDTKKEDEVAYKLIVETIKEKPCNQTIDVLVESWINELALSQNIWRTKNNYPCLRNKN
jgi:hypothetical protein